MVVGPKRRWGTWEELILGGAVLRHGTDDWSAVASELKARTLYPNSFTPEACKARYENLRKRYSGCSFWFEELRKRRIEELRRELKRSEGSIGSLKSKIEFLKAERERSLPVPVVKLEGIESSAGSFTRNFNLNESPGCQVQGLTSAIDAETNKDGGGTTVRKRRAQRKRKDILWDSKEGSIGESGNLCSASAVSFSHSKEASDGCDDDETRRGVSGCTKNAGLMDIFNSIAQREPALVFRHRLDSQKRARYKRTIRRHLDMETIRSRILTLSIRLPEELFRDLLLLANNAVIFYSKRTREHKAALSLRDDITKACRRHQQDMWAQTRISPPVLPTTTPCRRPVKPRSARPRTSKHRIPANTDAVRLLSDDVAGKRGCFVKQPGKAKRVSVKNPVWGHFGKEDSSLRHKTVSKDELVAVVGPNNNKPVVKKRKIYPGRV
ncbi:unnamed protein product [Cuscuta campestris]|uniref:Bromo domain-containing protein n=1 Tax=Cuscuta campestris TaxID=132261 RepID=A0A484MJ65_9ASTE|nr:unnamed protein product [Cuscuta campestris]